MQFDNLNHAVLSAIRECTTVIEDDKKTVEDFIDHLGTFHISTFFSKETLKSISTYITAESDRQDVIVDFILNIRYHMNMMDIEWEDVVKNLVTMRDSLSKDTTLPKELVEFYQFEDVELEKETTAIITMLVRLNIKLITVKTIEN